MRNVALLIFTLFLMFGCIVDQGKVAVDIKRKTPTTNASTLSATVSNVQIINNQIVITGVGLSSVTNVKVDGNSLNQNFTIESKSATQIIANAVNAFSFDVSKVFNLILSDASAAATFPIDFSICNATLNGHGFNCAISATDKDVLSFDAVSGKWKPRSINGLNYQGTWDASTAEPSGPSAGDYYIVSVANPPYGVGDWIVWNGTAYDKISNSTTITSVFGRSGAIVATKGDYDLNKLTDVDLTVPATIGQVLKFDGAKWVAGSDLSGGGAGSVTTAELANASVTDAKIDTVSATKITGTITSAQITDGTIVNADISATAAIDYSKLNIPNTTIPYAKLNIANGDIPAAKISGLPSATAVLATTITDNDTTHAPDGNAVHDALATKLNTTGGTLTVGTISGVPNPTNNDDVANKAYVDSAISGYISFTEADVLGTDLLGLTTGVAGPISATDTVLGAMGKLQYQVTDLKGNGQWIKTGNDIAYSAGNVTVDKSFMLKDSGSNHVEIKAPATATTNYVLTLPPNDGNADQVLRTDGNGVLTWVNVSDSNVQTFAKTTLPTCAAGEVLKSNGTTLSCVTDVSGGGAFTGSNDRAVATDGSGALTSSATTATELGYVSGVTSSIQTQLNAKQATITAGTTAQYFRGDKTFVTLDTSVVPENTNLYFTTARAKSATVADSIADAITDVAPSQNAVHDALALKISTTGGTLTVGTINGVPNPTNNDDVANKAYADTKIAKSALPTCAVGEVLKSDGTNITCVTDNSGGGAFSGTASRIVQTGTGGALEVSAVTTTELGYVSGVTSAIQTQLNAKQATITATTSADYYRGDKTFATLNTTAVPEGTALYFTEPRVLASLLTSLNTGVNGPITATDSVLGAFGKLQYQITDLKTFDTSVQTFAKTTLPTCAAGEVLKSNGTAFSCVTDASGAGAFSGTASRAIASDGSGALSVSATTATELGYVSGVTSAIQTQLNAKQATITAGTTAQYYRGDKTFVTLDTAAVPENTNLYFTTARAKSASVADAIADAVIDVAPSQNAVFDALALKLNKTGGTLSIGTISGVPTPTNNDDVANKAYVDSKVSGSSYTTIGTFDGFSTNIYTGLQVGNTATATGTSNEAYGDRALQSLTTGYRNVAFGISALGTVTTGASNIGIGQQSGNITTGTNNIAIGNGVSVNSATGNDQLTIGNWIYGVGGNIGIGAINPSEKFEVAGNIALTGKTRFKSDNANYVEMIAPTSLAATYTLTFPPTAGSNNQVLTTNGSGVLTWTTPATGGAPTGTAGGDLGGSYPNPTISALAATKIGGGAVDNTEFSYLDGVTSSIQTQLIGKQASDATLTSLAAFNTNGILVQTAADTFAGRSIAGTANRVTVTNGDGVAANPTINLDTTLFPSPVAGDAGKFLKATAANTSAWSTFASGDITTALGFTPLNKAGDTMTTGTWALSGTAALTVPNPVNVLDVANKQYVDGFGQWTKGTGGNSGDLYRSSGNIGIGTSTPSQPLEISVPISSIQMRLRRTGTSAAFADLGVDGVKGFSIWPDGYATTSAVPPFVINPNGNVGLGTVTAASPLQLGEVFSLQQDINSGYIGANFGHNTSGKYLKSQFANQIHFDSATGQMNFKVAPSGTAGDTISYITPMRIYPSGDIGMGVSSPIGSLHIARNNPSGWNASLVMQSAGTFAGTSGAGHLQTFRTRGTEAAPAAVQSGDYLGALDFVGYGTSPVIGASVESIATETWSGSATGASMIFKTSSNTTFNSPSERMRIDQNGAIGIGNITPASSTILDVASTTKGFAPPRMTKTQRDAIASPITGLMVYNTTNSTMDYYNGTSWLAMNGSPKYIKLKMSGAQTVDVNYDVAFDTTYASSGMTRSGYGVQLKAGVVYRIEAAVNTNSASGLNYLGYALHNGTSFVSENAYTMESENTSYGFKAQLLEFYKPAVDEVVTVRISDDGIGTGTVQGAWNTYFMVTEVVPSGPSTTSDNMGNHTAVQNLNLGNYWLSTDGTNGGLKATSSGIFVKPVSGTATFQMQDGVPTTTSNISLSSSLFKISNNATAIELSANTNAGITNQIFLANSGNVGMGNAAPGSKLDVTGVVNATGGFTSVSDRRLKKNIKTLDDALLKILGLRGVEFDWKKDGTHEIGLIAQEVETVVPTLVRTDLNGMKAVKYANIVALLIEAMKIEHKKVEENLAMMRTMQSTIADHGRRIASIETELETQKKLNQKLQSENKMMKAYLCSKDNKAPFCR